MNSKKVKFIKEVLHMLIDPTKLIPQQFNNYSMSFFLSWPSKNKTNPASQSRTSLPTFREEKCAGREIKVCTQWGRKRCKMGRVIKPRIDPRVSWPRLQDFQSSFGLPQQCVEELTAVLSRALSALERENTRNKALLYCCSIRYFKKNIYIYPRPHPTKVEHNSAFRKKLL